jgi:hypothetical protein
MIEADTTHQYFPIFLASFQADNKNIAQIFIDLSCNKPPRGVKIDEEKVWSTLKDKSFNYIYTNDDAETIYTILKPHLQKIKNVDIIKPSVYNIKSEQYQQWKGIRTKSDKEQMLITYVRDNMYLHKLSLTTSKKLMVQLKLYIMEFHIITTNEIIVVNGFITSIKGVIFSEGTYHINRNITLAKKKESTNFLYNKTK